MSLNEIPGSVTIRRQWPLATVLSLQAAILWFVFDTRSSIADLDRRAERVESRAAKLEIKDERRSTEDVKISTDIAVIKATVESIRELLREDRRARGDRP